MKVRTNDWFRLDNAAKIYPVLSTERYSHVFRVSTTLTEKVIPSVLQQAIEELRPRFPSFYVHMRLGLFWFFFEPNPKPVILKKETSFVCEKIKIHANNGYLFTFFYYENRISLEVFHALSDGHGAIQLLKAVLKQYLILVHDLIMEDDTIFSVGEVPSFLEFSDCYERNYIPSKRVKIPLPSAYLLKGKLIPIKACGIVNSSIPTDQLLALARKHDASITQFVAALLIYCVLTQTDRKKMKNKLISLTIPINLRPIYHSQTLRNFSLYFYTTFKPKGDIPDLKEILEKVKQDFKEEMVEEKIQNKLNNNVRASKNFLLRITPLFLKMILLKIAYSYYGKKPSSFTFSNFGVITLPEEMMNYVQSFTFNLGSGSKPAVALNSYNNTTKIIFSRAFLNTDLERTFFTYLTSMGVDVVIESNYLETNFIRELKATGNDVKR